MRKKDKLIEKVKKYRAYLRHVIVVAVVIVAIGIVVTVGIAILCIMSLRGPTWVAGADATSKKSSTASWRLIRRRTDCRRRHLRLLGR